MTPGDVMDQIIRDDSITHFRDVAWGQRDECGDVILMWDKMLDAIRPNGPHHLPLSPPEIKRLRTCLRVILSALSAAEADRPAHFYVVQEGGR